VVHAAQETPPEGGASEHTAESVGFVREETPAGRCKPEVKKRGVTPGVLKHRTVAAFLVRNGFERVRGSTPEETYRHAGGGRISVPRHPGRDIQQGTRKNILRRLEVILGRSFRVVSGEIVEAQEAGQETER
jgi:predicted RNA binding protein YcfA (HicA-like mRNA interferase family)